MRYSPLPSKSRLVLASFNHKSLNFHPRPTFPEHQVTELVVTDVFFGRSRHLVEVEVAVPDLEVARNVVQVKARTLQLVRTLQWKFITISKDRRGARYDLKHCT